MTHEYFESIAALDALGAAPGGDVAALRLHVTACVHCRRARDEYARAAMMLAFALDPIPPPRILRERICCRF
jgi:hypothetical protein